MNTQTSPAIAGFARLAFLGCACFSIIIFQSPVQAQDDEAAAIEEIVVTGIRRSLDLAADIKRDSDAVVDAITAQDIGLFSDNNIGEALSRVPGVLLEREAGEGYRISIRGLGPRFVRTTVNGRTALSASGGETGGGDDARGFTYNIMPSEVVSKAKVSKSTQAWEIEGGIGGVVDLETNRPLEFSIRQVPRAELINWINETSGMIEKVVPTVDLSAPFPKELWNLEMSNANALLRILWHLGWHLGQINYHRRIIFPEME